MSYGSTKSAKFPKKAEKWDFEVFQPILEHFSICLHCNQLKWTEQHQNGPKICKIIKNWPFRANLRPFYGLGGVAKTGFGAVSANALAFLGTFAPGTPGMD